MSQNDIPQFKTDVHNNSKCCITFYTHTQILSSWTTSPLTVCPANSWSIGKQGLTWFIKSNKNKRKHSFFCIPQLTDISPNDVNLLSSSIFCIFHVQFMIWTIDFLSYSTMHTSRHNELDSWFCSLVNEFVEMLLWIVIKTKWVVHPLKSKM